MTPSAFSQPGPGMLVMLAGCAFWAGIQNALAGGGSFITFPALLLSGLDPRAANITSTLALFPGQVTAGLIGRKQVSGVGQLGFRALLGVSLIGGALGALLLLATPPAFFARLVPWLILFATAVFAWGSFGRRDATLPRALPPGAVAAMQFAIAMYGGYFGGGIGFLMLAALTLAGMVVRSAGATKNALAAAMNASAVAIFLFSGQIAWRQAGVVAVAAIAGGVAGGLVLRRVNEKLLRGFVVLIGVLLTIGMFWRRG